MFHAQNTFCKISLTKLDTISIMFHCLTIRPQILFLRILLCDLSIFCSYLSHIFIIIIFNLILLYLTWTTYPPLYGTSLLNRWCNVL